MKRVVLLLLIPSLAFGTITNVQHVTNSGSAVTTASGLALTVASTGAGNLLVADCNTRDNSPTGTTIAVSDNQSQVWQTPAAGNGVYTGVYYMASFYLLSTVAGVTTVTFKPSGGGGSPYTSMICDVAEYSTTASGFAFDVANFNPTATTAGNTESVTLTTTLSNDVIFSATQNGNGDSGTALAGFTNLDASSLNGRHQNQEQRNAAAGAYTAGQDSAGISNAQGYVATVEAFGETTVTPITVNSDGLIIKGGKTSIKGGKTVIK